MKQTVRILLHSIVGLALLVAAGGEMLVAQGAATAVQSAATAARAGLHSLAKHARNAKNFTRQGLQE